MKSLLRLLVSMSLLGYVGLVAAEKPEAVAVPTTVAAGRPASVLIDRGIPCTTIVLPAEAGPAEKYAAANLQSVFQKMTGVRLAIVGDDRSIEGNRILIGNTRFTDAVVPANERKTLDKEGYIVRLRGRDLALAGGGPYGTIYAVDELYDRLGARWYLPGDLGEVIPHLDTIRFNPLDVRRTPSFAMRWVGDNVAWNLHNRTNRVADAGLPPAFVVYPGIYHTQSELIPHSRYDATHPEFFALIHGERSTSEECKLCNSSPLLPTEIAHNMAAMLRQTPGIDLISLSPTDGQMWCQCEECRKLDEPRVPRDQEYSRRQMVLYNRVADELHKEFPRQQILVGAYNVYTWPPKDPAMRGNPNLAVVICHYEPYCLAHPVNDPSCARNARYLELIRAWQRHTQHIYFYEYYYKVNWCDLPWPIVHTVAADIPFFKSLGVEGLYTQYTQADIWSNFLVHYVAARLLWDHTTDVHALLEEFYRKFYGEAAEPMKRYHEALERQMASCGKHLPGDAQIYATAVFTEPVLAELQQHLADASRIASNDLVKRRIEKIACSTQYTVKLTAYFRQRDRALRLPPGEQKAGLDIAIKSLEALRAEVRRDHKRYEGISSGECMSDDDGLGSEIANLRAKAERHEPIGP